MVVFNYSGGEINAKVVYYGPALSGKTTNLEYIYDKMPSGVKGKMVSMKTRTDRTLFFDFLPLELGEINGYQTRILLYTVPGQVYYNATRKLVLKGADAVVFVADSSAAKMQENIESLRNLEENLNELGLTLDTIPWVIQYNKRDLPDALPVDALNKRLNLLNVPYFEAVATTGDGLYETFQAIAGMLYKQLAERLEKSQPRVAVASPPAEHREEPRGVVAPPRSGRFTTPEPAARTVTEVLDAALREVDGPPPTRPAAELPQKKVAPSRPEPPALAARPKETIDEEVGRVVDLDGDELEAETEETRSFVLDPFHSSGGSAPRLDAAKERVRKPERESRGEGDPKPEELLVTVPVVITRSQMRKTIPVKLSLEISVVDDGED